MANIGLLASFLVVCMSVAALVRGWNTAAGTFWAMAGIASGAAVFGLAYYFVATDPHSAHNTRFSRSLSNMKMLAIAVQAYAQDHDGRLPGWVETPDGRLAHNAWDGQILPSVKSPLVFTNLKGPGIRSYSDPERKRMVTYGLNGLLITPKKRFNGTADWSRPEPRRLEEIADPASTILFAELATESPMPGVYGRPPEPAPAAQKRRPDDTWWAARDGWIDIDPLAFVETSGPRDSYDPEKWDTQRGVARGLYGGGGCYAFVDGHVKFMKLSQTVRGHEDIPPERYWSPDNPHNLWNPDNVPEVPPSLRAQRADKGRGTGG